MRGIGKRTGVIVLAVVLSLGIAVSAGYGAKSNKVASEVEVEGLYITAPPQRAFIVGDVHSRKPKCEKGRTVTLFELDDPSDTGIAFATVETDGTGDWAYEPPGDDPDYTVAEVARRKVTTKKRKLVCKADRSPPLITD